MTTISSLCILGAALLLSTASVSAQPAAHVRGLAAVCANCHGSEGHAIDASAVPGLAAMPAPYIVEQMKAFRAGTRPSTVMQQIAKGFSDTQVEQLAAYFAAQPK